MYRDISYLVINGDKLRQSYQFKHLGTFLSSDGRKNTEMTSGVALSKEFPENEGGTIKQIYFHLEKKKSSGMLY